MGAGILSSMSRSQQKDLHGIQGGVEDIVPFQESPSYTTGALSDVSSLALECSRLETDSMVRTACYPRVNRVPS